MSNAINKLIPPKLEPCPHCGAEPIMKPREHNVSYIVICWRCGLNGPTDELGVQSCADSWNTLSRAARLLAAVEGLAATRHTFTAGEHMGSGLVILQDMGGTIHGEGRGPTLADALIALGEKTNG